MTSKIILSISTLGLFRLLLVVGLAAQESAGASNSWPPELQVARDEFNSTQKPETSIRDRLKLMAAERNSLMATSGSSARQIHSLRRLLMRYGNFSDCCPSWKNLSSNLEIQLDLKRNYGRSMMFLKPSDLMNELQQTFLNSTYLSIDGQPGESEWQKYYSFYDGVQYMLRLLKVAHSYVDQMSANSSVNQNIIDDEEMKFNKHFRRQLKSIEFKIHKDPTLSSYISELLSQDSNTTVNDFAYYENFIRFTKFGQYYAQNISAIRESVVVFDQICSHLKLLGFSSNFTRPSKQYEMNRRMSYELYLIRSELYQQINPRILANRQDVRRILAELEDFSTSRPYIRMLGDEFSSSPPYFSSNVRQLTHLLDLYTTNSLTQVSFYDQLSELPEDFIILGATIAHDYETREIPRYSRFDSDYFNWNFSRSSKTLQSKSNSSNLINDPKRDARGRSNLSFLGSLIG